jgi:hypothetical protein
MPDREKPDATSHSPDNPGSWGKSGDLARRDPDKLEALNGATGAGQSGGGAYPNPHTGKDGGGADGYMGHGGQTEMPYHGGGRLGEQKTGENVNAPAENTSGSKDEEPEAPR